MLQRPFQRMDYLHSAAPVGSCLKDVLATTNKPNFGLRCNLTQVSCIKVRELLRPVARPGDIIYDPFSGSGTTGAVAFEFGSSYIGVDVNPNFNQLASARLNELNK